MYLARKKEGRFHRFILRESFRRDGVYLSRDLIDLGFDPGSHIVYPGGNAFYIDPDIEDELDRLGVEPDNDQLEDLFWPFLKPRIQHALEGFRNRTRAYGKKTRLSAEQNAQLHRKAHIFDKRRIHYLRSGRADQRGLGRMPPVLLKWLRGKSRDEIEQRFMTLETVLRPTEIKAYVFVVFDMQKFFPTNLAQRAPQVLDQDQIDAHFIDEICRLNDSNAFWGAAQNNGRLHDYLVRYLIMHFDHDFPGISVMQDAWREFINRHRTYRPPTPKATVNVEDASTIFGVKKETMRTMTRRGLTRLYRRLARKLHPDTGGDAHKFIRLTEAYQSMLRKKTPTDKEAP